MQPRRGGRLLALPARFALLLLLATVGFAGPAAADRAGTTATGRSGGSAEAERAGAPVQAPVLLTSTLVARRPTSPRTIPGIVGRVPRSLTTVPFTPRQPDAHISPIFAELSIGGFGIFVLIGVVQLLLTRPRRRGRRTL